MVLEQVQRAVKQALSPPRYAHTVGVVQTAQQLAARYGIDGPSATLAAWLHDIAREWTTDRLLQAAEDIEIPAGFGAVPVLLHGPIAAHIGRTTFGIDDDDILHAVCYHTTGRVGMSQLEKVIFIADAIEPGRQYEGVEALRALASRNLDEAVLASLQSTIQYLLSARKPIFPLTVMVRNAFLENQM